MDVKTKILGMIQKRDSVIPSLPIVIDKIISAASSEKTTTEDLADLISHDQGMTTKLLKLSNSIYYAQKTRVATIKRAISVIGFDEIIGIATGMGILSSFSDKSGMSLDMKALWIHAIGVATTSKALAMRTNPAIANKIFIPGLLHDMGKIIFSIYFKKEYMQVRQAAIENKRTLYHTENEILKLDHAVLSALLMKRWQFPQSIMIPCRFHHSPESCPVQYRHQALIINLANYLTQKAGIGHSGNPVPVTIKNVSKKIGIAENILRLTIDQLKRKEEDIKDFFKITTEA
ncbi:HDOD domain-containing protein [Desulfospira joergensenii]|uniref:HDOD domain-containing protein n=1 Tax=Desulfospira joergensenii TaxID=53329 RepID=UPI0003B44FE5|nr:HDOD domain-containing protein [Desulfospira joergensenii]